MNFRIEQVDLALFRLAVTDGGSWRLVGDYGSENAALDAMNTQIARSKFSSPAAKFYDASGALTTQPVLP